MPKIVNEMPASRRGAGPGYPWPEWADGQVREFVAGVDFDCTPNGFRISALSAAERLGYDLEHRVRGSSVWLRFIERAPVTPVYVDPDERARREAYEGGVL